MDISMSNRGKIDQCSLTLILLWSGNFVSESWSKQQKQKSLKINSAAKELASKDQRNYVGVFSTLY